MEQSTHDGVGMTAQKYKELGLSTMALLERTSTLTKEGEEITFVCLKFLIMLVHMYEVLRILQSLELSTKYIAAALSSIDMITMLHVLSARYTLGHLC